MKVPDALPTDVEAELVVDRVLASARARLGHRPSATLMRRWALVYRAVANGLDAEAAKQAPDRPPTPPSDPVVPRRRHRRQKEP